MRVNLIMLGPPGAGKGTQAERFARIRGIPKISTGDILREAVTNGTELGRIAKATMDAGKLVGDDVMVGIVRERLLRPDTTAGFVLDGFPRTVAQAEALDAMMNGRGPLVVLDFAVPPEELERRLAQRRVCGKCGWTTAADGETVCAKCGGAIGLRSDDAIDVVRKRLQVYQRDTMPLVRVLPVARGAAEHRRRPIAGGSLGGGGRGDRQDCEAGDRCAEPAEMIVCKSPAELRRMRAANQVVAEILADLAAMTAPGVTTADLDQFAEARVRAEGAVPAFKGYRGYPATLCASVNHEVVHGIPSKRKLNEGDILSLDMGVLLDGFYGDSAVTVGVGRISDEAAELLRVTRGGAAQSDRPGAGGRAPLGYRQRHPALGRGARVLGRARVRRARDWRVAP